MGEKWTDRDDNARNLDGTPYTGHYGGVGDAAKTLAAQRELAPSRTPEQRKADARNGTITMDPKVRAAIDALHDIIAEQGAKLDDLHVANRHLAGRLDKAEAILATQSQQYELLDKGFSVLVDGYKGQMDSTASARALITEQGAKLDDLHVANRHLAGRLDKAEREFKEWKDRQHGINSDIYQTIHRENSKLALAAINGDDAMEQRLRARTIEIEHRLDKERMFGLAQAALQIRGADLLATFIDKVERQIFDHNHIGLSKAISLALASQADDFVKFKARAIAAFPVLGTPTIQEQCAAVEWRPPTKEDEG